MPLATAALDLPNPGATGSLSANTDLVIDGIAPFVSNDTRTYVLEATNPFGISDVGLSAKPNPLTLMVTAILISSSAMPTATPSSSATPLLQAAPLPPTQQLKPIPLESSA